MAKYLDLTQLTYYDQKIKGYIDDGDADSLKYVEFTASAIKFYTHNPKGTDESPAFTVDFPAEYVLDQAKTTFVSSFVWSETDYPGSTNPSLDGEPVLVLVVKGGEADSYSFLNMKKLIDVYTGGATSSATASVNSSTNEITVDVKISATSDNVLTTKDDGLYVPPTEVDSITSTEIDSLFS